MEQKEQLFQKYNGLVKASVRRFISKRAGYKVNMVVFDTDDLEQECMVFILESFIRSDCDMEDFFVRPKDLYHCMCEYTQRMLPVKVSHRTHRYTQNMREISSVELVDSMFEVPKDCIDDTVFNIDMNALQENMSAEDRSLFSLLRAGCYPKEIAKEKGITSPSVVRARTRIGKKYNRYTKEKHVFIWRKS